MASLSASMRVAPSAASKTAVVARPSALAMPRRVPIAGPVVASLHCQRTHHLVRAALVEAPAADSSFASMMDDEDEEGEYEEADSDITVSQSEEVDETLLVDNLGLSQATCDALKKRGINALFAIQKAVYQPGMEGRDLIGRAKTGSGKTLAFALPVVESLMAEDNGARPVRGRSPRCIVLAPTRELANQVAREFAWLAPSLKMGSFYGGTSIGAQIRDLETGVDVVVGTPGRVIDLIERGSLKLDAVRFAILDEADQMLDMGFEEDMENILGYVPEERQTYLFSATMPKWVKKVAKKFQKNPLMVDLVGSDDTGKLCDTIRLMLMQVEHSQKANALMDAISMHSMGGKTIIFTNTKAMADQVCEHVNKTIPCVVLHGDIAQAQRDRGLALFRSGKFQALVATDVAARGLDIPSVELVAHYDVPLDAESFLHRSGRTGRAGKTGTALILFTDREQRSVGQILKATHTDRAEMIGPAPPAEVMTQASRNVLTTLDKVDAAVIEFFVPAAERLIASGNPTRVLAAALASMSGFSHVPQPRSLLTYETGKLTLRLLGSGSEGKIDGWNSLVKVIKSLGKAAGMTKSLEFSIGKIRILENQGGQDGCCFDLPTANAEALLAASDNAVALGYVLDKAVSISVDVNAMLVGSGSGGRGPPRSDSYGGGSRGRSAGAGSWGGGSSRGGSAGGGYKGSSDRGGGGGYKGSSDRGGGGYSGGYSGGGGGGYKGDSGGGGYKGRSSGGYGADAGGGASESWGGGGGGYKGGAPYKAAGSGASGGWGERSASSSRAAPKADSWGKGGGDGFYDAGSDNYFEPGFPSRSSSGGRGSRGSGR
ncbi:hypothetical protein FOA52_007197 [Chlamydomonas sp. UWO 241]|nr:hypothetical protein FOA52_007197 [Chlamydomonas sp. UWO 241]